MSAKKADDLKYAKLVAKVWADESFKDEFLADPARVLADYDIDVPEGMDVRVVEDSEDVMHLVIPKKPYSAAFSEKQFDGGEHGCRGCFGCGGCRGGD